MFDQVYQLNDAHILGIGLVSFAVGAATCWFFYPRRMKKRLTLAEKMAIQEERRVGQQTGSNILVSDAERRIEDARDGELGNDTPQSAGDDPVVAEEEEEIAEEATPASPLPIPQSLPAR